MNINHNKSHTKSMSGIVIKSVSDSLTSNCKIADTQLGLNVFTLKPLHAGWLFHAFDFATRQTDVFKYGW